MSSVQMIKFLESFLFLGCGLAGIGFGAKLALRPTSLELYRRHATFGRLPPPKLNYSRAFLLYVRVWGWCLVLLSLLFVLGAGRKLLGLFGLPTGHE